jgi:hypothetical protein
MSFRFFYLLALTVVTICVTSCKKNEPAPTTGNLSLTFTYDSIYAGYSLFTEEGWRTYATTGISSPLRRGMFSGTYPATNARVKTSVTFSNLNAGNYVFVVTTSTAQTVQVTAGQTSSYSFDL